MVAVDVDSGLEPLPKIGLDMQSVDVVEDYSTYNNADGIPPNFPVAS